MKREPILELARISLISALFHLEDKESPSAQEIECALENINEAIEAVQGALEDIHRVSGRVPVCTELHNLLAPNELTFKQLIALHPRLETAYGRLMRLDANGACCTATDIQDAVVYGHLSAPDAERFAQEIEAACDVMEMGES